jgi:hypothetical protein
MSYHGIPIRLIPTDPETHEPQSNFETAVFATIHRTPELAACLKAFNRFDVAEDAARAKAILARRALLAAETPEAIDAAEALAQAATEASETATAALAESVRAFLVCGFKGAGYDDLAAERYADMVPMERLRELKAAALVGSGRLDFTKPLATATTA